MRMKVLTVILAVCLILGMGIWMAYALAPGVNAGGDFGHPWWAFWTTKHRATADFTASHAKLCSQFLIPTAGLGIRGQKSMVSTTPHTQEL